MVTVVLLACFWATAIYAQDRGAALAGAMASDLGNRPAAVVFSERQLAIAGPGVQMDRLGGEDALYRYRYSGLRLLVRSDNRWCLIPAGWTRHGNVSVITLPESDGVRVDYDYGPQTA